MTLYRMSSYRRHSKLRRGDTTIARGHERRGESPFCSSLHSGGPARARAVWCGVSAHCPRCMDMGHGTTSYTAFEDLPRKRGWTAGACWRAICHCCRLRAPEGRLIKLNAGTPSRKRYPKNAVQNTKYSPLTFIPKVLYEQFRCKCPCQFHPFHILFYSPFLAAARRCRSPAAKRGRHWPPYPLMRVCNRSRSFWMRRRLFQPVLPARGALAALPAASNWAALHVRALGSPASGRPYLVRSSCLAIRIPLCAGTSRRSCSSSL